MRKPVHKPIKCYTEVDLFFLHKSILPRDKAVKVASVLSGVSQRTVRKQFRKHTAK